MKTKHALSVILIATIPLISLCQNEWTKERKDRLANGEIYFEITDYNRALKVFDRLLTKFPDDQNLNYKIGVCHFYLDETKIEATEYLIKAKQLGSTDASYFLGQIHHLNEEFDKARSEFEKYKTSDEKDRNFTNEDVDYHLGFIDVANQLMKEPVNVSIYNIGEKVNSPYPDYGPLIPADESIMIFTSRRPGSTGDKVGPYNKYYEDIYIAKNVNGKFEKTTNMGEPVNTTTHDAAVGLSADGNTLLIYKTNRAQTGGDLYYTFKEDTAWTKPKKFSDMINSDYQESSASLSPDGITMYFSSTREGGFGGRDIYRAVLLPSGQWSLPMNLGPNINTKYDEDGPFIHPDGKTLYFSSNGHKSMGGYDVFKSSYKEDHWSTPENMGYPINSTGNDVYFVLTANGKRGYYSSFNEADSASHDIYVISFETELQQMKIIKGIVMSEKDRAPLKAKIILLDSEDNVVGEFNTNELTGSYIVLAKPDKNYKMTIEADGYIDYEEDLIFDGGRLIKEINKEIALKPAN